MIALPLFLLALIVPSSTVALTAPLAGVIDWHQPHIGIPLTHQSASPSFLPSNHLSKKTGCFVTLTKSNVIASVGGQNGSIEWRHQFPPGETALSYHPHKDVVFTLSGGESSLTGHLIDSTTGAVIWESLLSTSQNAERAIGMDVAFAEDRSGDVFILTGGKTLKRLMRSNGTAKWSLNISEDDSTLYSKVISTPTGLSVTGITKNFLSFTLTSHVVSSTSGIIVSSSTSSSISDPSTLLSVGSALQWLDKTTVHSLSATSGKTSTLKGKFRKIIDVQLSSLGYFLAIKESGESVIVKVADGTLETIWEFKESADDATHSPSLYSGYIDPSGNPYITRFYWSHTLKLGSVHTYAINGDKGSGVFSGHTVQFDTAAHGVVVHAATEVVPKNEYLNYVRVALTTSTGAIVVYEHGEHVYTLEESLSSIKGFEFLDLPEKMVVEEGDKVAEESWVGRVQRHVAEFKEVPQYIINRLTSSSSAASALSSRSTLNATSLWKDQFGLQKLLLIATSTGKVFALDSSSGAILWSTLVGVSIGEDEGLDVKGLYITRTSIKGDRPIVVVIGTQTNSSGSKETVAFEIDALSGLLTDTDTQGTKLFDGEVQEVFKLDQETDSGVAYLALLDRNSKIHVFPKSEVTTHYLQDVSSSMFFTKLEVAAKTLSGLRAIAGDEDILSCTPVWTLNFETEEISDIVYSNGEPVASFGRVINDRKALYKYLNPSLMALSTVSITSGYGTIYVIDASSGSVVYQLTIKGVATAQGIKITLVENWLVYTFLADGSDDDEMKGWRIGTVELYEPGSAKDKIKSSELSSFSPDHEIVSNSKSFVFQYEVKAILPTSTKYGITTKDIIIANDLNQIISIPRKLLDPRRPTGKPSAGDKEEMLIPYNPLIALDPKRVISHGYDVVGVRHLKTSPALLESTSLVAAYGLDLFVTKVMPSGTFDILPDSFNKLQLLLTIAGLSAGIVIVRPIVSRKKMRAKWY